MESPVFPDPFPETDLPVDVETRSPFLRHGGVDGSELVFVVCHDLLGWEGWYVSRLKVTEESGEFPPFFWLMVGWADAYKA